MNDDRFEITDQWILAGRGGKNQVDRKQAYAWLVEKERTHKGIVEDTGIIFLTNRECQYHCLMCDLWKNTLDESSIPGDIPHQVEKALAHMPGVRHVKLYNSGSFFDGRAIPEEDYPRIASLLGHCETVIVESHPRLINGRSLRFRDMLKGDLQVAMGLETVHPEMLRKLNKRMTLEDFENAARFLKSHHISSRAFILLRPPFMTEEEGVLWAEKSLDFAFSTGVECCTVIPVRAGNGAMEKLAAKGWFTPPSIDSLEKVLEYGLSLKAGRVFGDTWDLHLFSTSAPSFSQQLSRIQTMNLTQTLPPRRGTHPDGLAS